MKRKKSNIVILLLLFAAFAATAAASAICTTEAHSRQSEKPPVAETAAPEAVPNADTEETGSESAAVPSEVTVEAAPAVVEILTPPNEPVVPAQEETQERPEDTSAEPASMENTLFIGDSRTVGLSEYAQIEGAHFFSTVGLSVYDVNEEKISVPEIGKVTLGELLANRQYDRIYIMLGINELGYPFEQTVKKYRELIETIQDMQEGVPIFVQANLHVTKERSDRDKVINNPAIDALNEYISQFADNENIFYLDANCIFDDVDGALDQEKSGDTAHPLAKYYQEWGNWIAAETGKLLA